jgi:serine O-acetyltransferase
MEINHLIAQDLYRYYSNISYRGKIKTVFSHSGARFMFLYRMCSKYPRKSFLGFFFRLWFKILSKNRNIEIPHKCNFGGGLYLGHFMNIIIINQNVIIGQNCNIMQGVTIGNESRGKRKGSPGIGNRVLIGPNSVVVGNIKIGDDVLIGPLTFVNFDVPEHSVVVGNPAKIVSNKGSKGYINKILEE